MLMTKIYFLLITLFLSVFATSQNLVSISPAVANAGQTLNVTITGAHTHFVQTSGTAVNFSFSQTSATSVVNSVNVLNDSVLSANVTVPANVATGNYNVTTTNTTDGILSLTNGFHVNGVIPPSLVSINSATANAGQTLNVTITGSHTHFAQVVGNTLSFGFSQTSGTTVVNSLTVVNDTALYANVTIPANVFTGSYNVNVSNSMDGLISLANGFYVNGTPQPSIVSVNPSVASLGQTLNVTITGANTHYGQGAVTVVDFTFTQASGTTVAPFVNSINIVNNSSIVANVSIPSNAIVGNYIVRVYNTIDGYLFKNFYVYDNCYANYTTSYNVSNNQFTLGLDSVTVASAISYHWDFGDGTTSNLQTPSHVFAQDTTYNVCLKIKTSAIDSCTYCHIIGKDSSGVVLKRMTAGFLLNVVLNGNTVTGILSADKNESNFSINAFPNPVSNTVTISLNRELELKNAMLFVYGIDGQIVFEKPLNNHNLNVNTSDFANGLYFVKVLTINGSKVLKLVKQ